MSRRRGMGTTRRRYSPTRIVMNNQAMGRHPPRDTEGIYPFAGLPVRLGFPSCDDFQIIHNERGVATAVVARREFLRISRMCRVSGQLLPYRGRQTRQLQIGIHVYDPRFCGVLEHACDPNAFLDMSELWLWALKDIHSGERLSIDTHRPKTNCCVSSPAIAAHRAAVAGLPVTMSTPRRKASAFYSAGVTRGEVEAEVTARRPGADDIAAAVARNH